MKVVSYTWFRNDNSKYEHPKCGEARGKVFLNYLRLIVRAHHVIWGPYQLWIHHDDRVTEFPYFGALRRMERDGLLRLINCGPATELGKSMLWRLKPAWEPSVEYCVCRDVDSIPLPRDRQAVEEFILSGLPIHTIHGETGSHAGIMGGTTSVHCRQFKELINCSSWKEFIERNSADIAWNVDTGSDQHHLARQLHLHFSKVLVHELHHITDVPGVIRTTIDHPMPDDIHHDAAIHGDCYSRVIGGCDGVDAPYRFYNELNLPSIKAIQKCENVE